MSKNIVICCDGTSNQPAHDMTNVAKLYFALENHPDKQITYYHPGLGTMEPAGALTWWDKLWTVKLGLAVGRGIQDDIRDAYIFLINQYRPGDRVFMFGFSRGAYTVRAVTGLLTMYGLIQPGNDPLVPYAIRMMFAINRAEYRKDTEAVSQVFALARRFKETYSRDCELYFVGLWDTVSSVGWFARPTKLPYTANNPDIKIARHAIAIDEKRAFFPPNLWRPSGKSPSGPQDLQQVWFPGSHSDVGGGYPEGPESAQSKYPLEWMMVEAQNAGLAFGHDKVEDVLGRSQNSAYVQPGYQYPLHETLTGWWRLTEFVPKPHYDYETGLSGRRANLFHRRAIPPKSFVHESAYHRGTGYIARLPEDVVHMPHKIWTPP